MGNKRLTYSKSGVNTSRGDRFVERISPLAKQTHRQEVQSTVGGFAALAALPGKYQNPRIVVSTDGVGTKVLLAKQLKKFDTVGIDLVAMSVNDILTLGAEPLLFLDYYATSKIEIGVGEKIVSGISEGCKLSRCALVGGETAEMPQVYKKGDFDLAGFCVGVVDAHDVIDGCTVTPGDLVIGIPSSGVHSNGYSLVRAVLRAKKIGLRSKVPGMKKTLGAELLTPTRIYVPEILDLLPLVRPKAMAHITGGGIEGNLPRVLPDGTIAVIDPNAWSVPPVFQFFQKKGNISKKEMFSTFNMGIGFILVVSPGQEALVKQRIPDARVIGSIHAGEGEARVVL